MIDRYRDYMDGKLRTAKVIHRKVERWLLNPPVSGTGKWFAPLRWDHHNISLLLVIRLVESVSPPSAPKVLTGHGHARTGVCKSRASSRFGCVRHAAAGKDDRSSSRWAPALHAACELAATVISIYREPRDARENVTTIAGHDGQKSSTPNNRGR